MCSLYGKLKWYLLLLVTVVVHHCYGNCIFQTDIYRETVLLYSSTCHERTPSGPGKSVRTLQVAARHRDGRAGG